VTLEYDQRAAVFNLADALSRGFGSADYVGSIPLGQAAVGLAVSPGGRWLYATSEVAAPAQHPVGIRAPAVRSGPAPSASQAARAGIVPGEPPGTLTLMNLQRAETDPAHSVVTTVDAGCQPVRVVTAANGTQVWVTARASDDALCFAAALLVTDPSHALVAVVRVGAAPVGLTAVREGTLIVVADSDRFSAPGAHADLTVINVADALDGRPAIVGDIPAGLFPRDMTAAPTARYWSRTSAPARWRRSTRRPSPDHGDPGTSSTAARSLSAPAVTGGGQVKADHTARGCRSWHWFGSAWPPSAICDILITCLAAGNQSGEPSQNQTCGGRWPVPGAAACSTCWPRDPLRLAPWPAGYRN
jgi:hypothetical protein